MSKIAKYSKGTKVRIIDSLKRYTPGSPKGVIELFGEIFPMIVELKLEHNLCGYNISKEDYRVLDFANYKDNVIYLLGSDDYYYCIMIEDGIQPFLTFGNTLKNFTPPEWKENGRYDVEHWTPLRGGRYVKTIAVNVTKEKAVKLFEEQQLKIKNWRGSGYPSWIDYYIIVEHVAREYHAIKHENQLGDIYSFDKELNSENLSLLLDSCKEDFEKEERIYSRKDLKLLMERNNKQFLDKINHSLRTSTGKKDYQRVLKELKLSCRERCSSCDKMVNTEELVTTHQGNRIIHECKECNKDGKSNDELSMYL